MENIVPLILDTSLRPEVNGMAALSLGLIFLGTRHEEVGNAVLQNLMEGGQSDSWGRMLGVSLGLLFLGKQDKCEGILEACNLIQDPALMLFTQALLKGCAYVESGNVLQVQGLMHCVIKNMEKVHHNAGILKEVEKEEEEEEANKEEVVNEEDRKARRESREKRSKQVAEENQQVELE